MPTGDVKWTTLTKFPNYEITIDTDQPVIRKKQSSELLRFTTYGPGYRGVRIEGKTYYVHVIVAEQFVHNNDPVHKTCVDHKDRNKHNNMPSNLRWVTPAENARNKTSHMNIKYEFTNKISKECIPVEWGKITKEDSYYYDASHNVFYYELADDVYRILHVNKPKNGKDFVWMQQNGTHGSERVKITIDDFVKEQTQV